MSIGFIAASSFLAIIASLTVGEVNQTLAAWQWRVGVGLTVFIIVQFLILAPFRMWRNAIWITNVEDAIENLWDLHDEGVKLLNAHHEHERRYPGSLAEKAAQDVFVQQWIDTVDGWRERLLGTLRDFSPPEERRLKNVVTYEMTLIGGLNSDHDRHRNMLRVRLDRLSHVITLHHPNLYPE